MGSVHLETLGQNRGVHEYENISLSEVRVINILIINRADIDEFYETKLYESKHPMVLNEIPVFHELIDVIYLDLDRLIKKCKFNLKQMYIINMLMKGYSKRYIAEKLGCVESAVSRLLQNICEGIKKQNDLEWLDWIETSGMIRTKGEFKQCKKCGKWLRASIENFSPQKNGKLGYRSVCKECR